MMGHHHALIKAPILLSYCLDFPSDTYVKLFTYSPWLSCTADGQIFFLCAFALTVEKDERLTLQT